MSVATQIRCLAAAGSMLALLVTTAIADVTNDRWYRLGEDAGEGAVIGGVVGANSTPVAGLTRDSQGPSGARSGATCRTRRPIGFAEPKARAANVVLTMIVPGSARRSRESKLRPATSGCCSASKKSIAIRAVRALNGPGAADAAS